MKRGRFEKPPTVDLGHGEFVDLPEGIWKAIKRGRPLYDAREQRLRVKAFADPHKPGYGGGAWPFDIRKMRADFGYRVGLRNAIRSDWVASNWKSVALKLYLYVNRLDVFGDWPERGFEWRSIMALIPYHNRPGT